MFFLYACRVPARASSDILKTYNQTVNKGRQLQKPILNRSPKILAERNFGNHYLKLPSSRCSSPFAVPTTLWKFSLVPFFKRFRLQPIEMNN